MAILSKLLYRFTAISIQIQTTTTTKTKTGLRTSLLHGSQNLGSDSQVSVLSPKGQKMGWESASSMVARIIKVMCRCSPSPKRTKNGLRTSYLCVNQNYRVTQKWAPHPLKRTKIGLSTSSLRGNQNTRSNVQVSNCCTKGQELG